MRSKHGHLNIVARTSPIALEQDDGGTTTPSDLAPLEVDESIMDFRGNYIWINFTSALKNHGPTITPTLASERQLVPLEDG